MSDGIVGAIAISLFGGEKKLLTRTTSTAVGPDAGMDTGYGTMLGSDLDVCRMFDQYTYKVSQKTDEIPAGTADFGGLLYELVKQRLEYAHDAHRCEEAKRISSLYAISRALPKREFEFSKWDPRDSSMVPKYIFVVTICFVAIDSNSLK